MLSRIQTLWPAFFAKARNAAAGTITADDTERPDLVITAAATSLALLLVGLLAILLGLT